MKNLYRPLLSFLILGLTTVLYGGAVPAIDVTVSQPSGKLAFKGKTSANGTFATEKLAPGDYVVQFNSKNSSQLKGNQYAVVVSAGTHKVAAEAVAGEKFAAGGIAMKVAVGAGSNISGQVASGSTVDSSKVKIIKGKRYVWVAGETGSNIGGKWVEEGSVSVLHVQRGNSQQLGKWQEGGTQGHPVDGSR